MQNDQRFMRYFPSKLPEGRLPDRQYFWTVLNTVNEPYVTSLVRHASDLRHAAAKQESDAQVIEVTDLWWDRLNAIPYVSCKSFYESNSKWNDTERPSIC